MILQPSVYLFKDSAKRAGPPSGRIGIRQYVWRDLYLTASLRAYRTFVSEVIEWGVGYRLRGGHRPAAQSHFSPNSLGTTMVRD